MKVLPVLAMAAILVLAFSAGAAAADVNEAEVQVLPSPSITLNVTNGTFYNLTFLGIGIVTPSGIYKTNFNENRWAFTNTGNDSYIYKSDVKLARADYGGNTQDSVSVSGEPAKVQKSLSAAVTISLNGLNYSLSNFAISNGSLTGANYSFPSYSVMEITISIVMQTPVQGPGALYLIQLIKSSNESNSAVKYLMGSISHNVMDRMQGDHEGMQIIPSAKSRLSAFYWWNNSFDLNGVKQNMTSSVGLQDGGIYIEFKFPFQNSLSSIYEDPYFGIPGTPLFKNPIIKKDFGQLVNYVVLHAEYLGTGVATGVAILGISYTLKRRDRF